MGGIGPGARVADRYAVLEEVGRGGMGVVYLARDDREGRDVAIKVLRDAPQGEAARRLQREARAMDALDPKGVAQVYDVGETADGELYLVMEFVRGRTLRAAIRSGRVNRADALRILRAVATTLGQAHRAGLVHRDVKPDNVMLCDDGRVVLLDFGIVKRLAAGEETGHLSTQLTLEGSVIGTPAYLSPEQALGRPVGPETDQFALAVMAYELLAGQLPWTAKEVTTILAQVLGETPMPASSVDTQLNASFDAVLSRALSKIPSRRFATVEELADALEAADRGDYVPLEVSETVALPPAAAADPAGVKPGAAAGGRRRKVLGAALSVLVVAGGAVALAERTRARAPSAGAGPVESAVTALAGEEGRFACPILEVRGVAEVATKLGAAAATVACARVAWNLGGRSDRVLPPAALLDLPREPLSALPDPYLAPEQRQRTVDLARARASAYLDGLVTREAASWHVELVVRSPEAREIARADGSDTQYSLALAKAIDALWRPPSPLTPRTIDREIARWTLFPEVAVGRAAVGLSLMNSSEGCPDIRARSRELGNALFFLERYCEALGSPAVGDSGAPSLDESSPEETVASVVAFRKWPVPLSSQEEQDLRTKLDGLRTKETSSIGRGAIDYAVGLLSGVHDPERAQAAFLLAVREDPLNLEAWRQLVNAAATSTASAASTTSLAAAWFPSESMFLAKAGSYRGDELEERIGQARLAYVLEPHFDTAMHLGRALAEAGRQEEVRSVASTPLDSPAQSRALEAYLLAFVDLHAARLDHAIPRLEAAGNIAMNELVVTSGVAGRSTEVATRWAKRFLSLPDDDVALTARGYYAPMALCMHAERPTGKRCLERVAALGRSGENWWGDAGETFLRGAQRYVLDDGRGAVAAWRSLVASPEQQLIGILPTDAFERAGEHDLAARLDARKLPYTFIGGVSEAAPREARRALAAGDKPRAKALAERVVQAWEVADVEIPAVADMKALLKSLHD